MNSPADVTKAVCTDLAALARYDTPSIRKIRQQYSRVLKTAEADFVYKVVRALLDDGGWPERVIAWEVLASHKPAFQLLNDKAVEEMADGLSEWGSIDLFGFTVVGQAWREGLVTDRKIHSWARSSDRWRRRLALVATVPLNAKSRGGNGDAERTLKICTILLNDRDDMVVKAMSWALRELAKRDANAVKEFIDVEASRLAPRVTREVTSKLKTGRKSERRRKIMTSKSLSCITVCLALGVSLIVVSSFSMNPTVEVSAQQSDKPVEQVQKNIQVLTGMPSSQLLPVMHFMRTSLGVRCDYCHVAENGKYWMDDKPAKQTARRMLRMVSEINKNNFGGRPVVTCNTCHRGSTKPVGLPAIGQGSFVNTTRDDSEAVVKTELPTVDQIFDKYKQALGGTAAIDKIKTRTTQVVVLRPKLVNSGTPKAAILNRAETVTIETFIKLPDKYLAITTTPDGITYQGLNGTVGWTRGNSGQRALNDAETLRLKRATDLYYNLKLRERYSQALVVSSEAVNGREAYVVEARSVDNKDEKLFFDKQSGFLVRRVVFTEIKLGLDPEQTDYEDYRKVDGVWLPFTVRTSYLDDNHYGTTRTIKVIKHNVRIDDNRFEAPPTSAK